MTPKQKVKYLVLEMSSELSELSKLSTPKVDASNIDALYDALDDTQDARSEVRGGQVETKLPCPYSRHYESKSVAAPTPFGWVGWTYWYGGGKHGEPEAIDWMSDAYDVDVTEETKTVVVQTFTKAKMP
jgi:hypothetical protein